MKTAEYWLHVTRFPSTDQAYAHQEFTAWIEQIQLDAQSPLNDKITMMGIQQHKLEQDNAALTERLKAADALYAIASHINGVRSDKKLHHQVETELWPALTAYESATK